MYLPFSSSGQVLTELQAAPAAASAPLWLLCIADRHGAELPELLASCRKAGMRVCGGIFPGLILGEEVRHEGIVAIPLPTDSRVIQADLLPKGIDWRTRPPAVSETDPMSSILLLDGLAPSISDLMEDLYNRYGNRLMHFGTGTGYHDLRRAPTVFTESGSLSQAALMILTPQRTTIRVRHGWRRIAGPFVASRTCGNVIQELNWEQAGTFYRKQVVAQNPDYADRPVFPDLNAAYPLCIAREGGEDVIRDPIRQTDDDEIVTLSDVSENSVMYLAHGDRDSLIAAASQAVDDCGKPDDVKGCFLCDCYSRTLLLGDAFPLELQAVGKALRRFTEVTPEGVLAMGEVATLGGQYLELFNKTLVVALTHR